MSQESSRPAQTPETMRRRLRLAVRQARAAADMTQKDAAAALDWSLSKLIRIEQGAVGVTTTDLQALLGLYGLTDEEQVAELIDLAKGSRRSEWSEFRNVYSQASLLLFGSEGAARLIRK